jgi:hypothetical protein
MSAGSASRLNGADFVVVMEISSAKKRRKKEE